VNDLTLQVTPGEIVAFLGPNGAGKTTTIDMMLVSRVPTWAQCRFTVERLWKRLRAVKLRPHAKQVDCSRIFTVGETVAFTASLYRTRGPPPKCWNVPALKALLHASGKCSGGEQQRLRFAMALLSDPRLLILDEPTTGMDVEGRREFWQAIREDAKRGRTILFATHYSGRSRCLCDRIVLIRQGSVVADGTTAEIKNLASGRRVRATLEQADMTALRALTGVINVEQRGDSVLVNCGDSDVVARYLLTQTDARDLEISSQNLEAAFVALTAKDVATAPTGVAA